MRSTWSAADRRAFADGNRLRARSIAGRRSPGPSPDEWDDEDSDDGRCDTDNTPVSFLS